MNGELEGQWLAALGFETQGRIRCLGLSEAFVADGRRGRLYVEVEWTGGMDPPHNVLKYGPFLETDSVHDMILVQFIMPTFKSFPSYVQLAQYTGELLTRTYPRHFRYHLEDMRDQAQKENETSEAYEERLENEFKERLKKYVKNYGQNWLSDQGPSFESQDKPLK